MPIFSAQPGVQTTAVGTIATVIWSTTGTGIVAGDVLKDLIIINKGPSTVYVGGTSTTTSTSGLPIAAGGQLTLQGYSSAYNTLAGNVAAITAAGGTATTICGLATLVSSA